MNEAALEGIFDMGALVEVLKLLSHSNPMWDRAMELIPMGSAAFCSFTADVQGLSSGSASAQRKKIARQQGCLVVTATEYRNYGMSEWEKFYQLFSKLFIVMGLGKTFNFPDGV